MNVVVVKNCDSVNVDIIMSLSLPTALGNKL